ncbi:MAG: helicase [Acutalibacter sp.]|nr:helicase [Acutalibacter sp.]
MEYTEFLKQKQMTVQSTGFEPGPLPEHLFDWQNTVTAWSIRRGRAALFEDCGLGKTGQQLSWAQEVSKQAGGPVLVLAPLAVAAQTRREGVKFGVPVTVAETAADIQPGVNVTNYEKLDKFDTGCFAGVVLDESSILKAYTGKVKRGIISAFENTPYRLSCSATPAPNDLMELLNQAEFLGIMKSSEALSCWFIADQSDAGHYRLKGHAEKDFWRWVASWAVCIEKPSDIGYGDDGYILPPLHENDVIVKGEASEDIFAAIREKPDMSATGFHKEKRRTIRQRAEQCAEIAVSSQEQFVVWCYQNDEADLLKTLIPGAVEIRGNDKAERKEQAALDFIDGKFRVLISKPSIFGYGLNFQNCYNMAFCGLDYSFESYYQAIRRSYRFGQKHDVNIWRVIGENEQIILDTIDRKARQKKHMARSMAEAMREFQTEALQGREFILNLEKQSADFPAWLRSEVA